MGGSSLSQVADQVSLELPCAQFSQTFEVIKAASGFTLAAVIVHRLFAIRSGQYHYNEQTKARVLRPGNTSQWPTQEWIGRF